MSLPEIASRLAAEAEAVCRSYLPAGRRQGAYWQDLMSTACRVTPYFHLFRYIVYESHLTRGGRLCF
jgi:hypothetical protein